MRTAPCAARRGGFVSAPGVLGVKPVAVPLPGRLDTENEMTKSLATRAAAAAVLSTAAAAAASEGAPEMQMEGVKPLLIIVGGLAVMVLVIWLGLKLLNRK
jgi:hypothetical protein